MKKDVSSQPLLECRKLGLGALLLHEEHKTFRKAVGTILQKRIPQKELSEMRASENLHANTKKAVFEGRPSVKQSTIERFAVIAFSNHENLEKQKTSRSVSDLLTEVFELLESTGSKHTSSILSRDLSPQFVDHAYAILILALLESSVAHRHLIDSLSVSDSYLLGVLHGYRGGSHPTRALLKKVVDETNLLHEGKLEEFLIQPNTLQGWKQQRKLVHTGQHAEKLRLILDRKVKCEERQWLVSLPKTVPTGLDDPNYCVALESIYFHTATHLGSEDMLDAAIADFGDDRWRQVVGIDPESENSNHHLRYSNKLIAQWVVDSLMDNAAPSTRRPSSAMNPIVVVEGGVGGLHSCYWLMKELKDRLGVEEPSWQVRYKGFEIVFSVCLKAQELLLGNAIDNEMVDDSRTKLFSSLYAKHLLPFEAVGGSTTFVDNCRMESGIMGMSQSKQFGFELPSENVDVYLASYAFHHIPNGEKLIQYLSGSSVTRGLPALCRAKPDVKKHFQETIKEFCNLQRKHSDVVEFRLFVAGYLKKVPPSPANVFISLFEPKGDTKYAIENLWDWVKNLDSNDWRIPNNLLVNVLANPQKMMLLNLHKVLKPNGLVAIADPDGTSSFNLENVGIDPEISIANFLDRDALRELLTSCGFEILNACTVERVDGKHHHYFEPPKKGLIRKHSNYSVKKPDDGNLGYVVVARKKPSFLGIY